MMVKKVHPIRTRVGNVVGSTITIGPASMSSTFCSTVKLSQSSGDNKVDITIISSAGHKQRYSFRLEDNNDKPKVLQGNMHGKINKYFFSNILQQVRYFVIPPDPKDVDLVLVDGCISDVGAFKMMDPVHDLPKQEVEKICYDSMLLLLEETTKNFLSAKVIATGYFQEISPDSMTLLAARN
jgi:hypothetical protein